MTNPARLFLPLLLMAALVAGAGVSAASAGNGGQPDHCKSVQWKHSEGDLDWYLHLKLCWNDMPKGGIDVTDVQETADPPNAGTHSESWETVAFRCNYVEFWNDNNVIQWRHDGSVCDIPANYGYRVWDNLNVRMPYTSKVTASMTGWPQLNDEPDPGYTKLKLVIP